MDTNLPEFDKLNSNYHWKVLTKNVCKHEITEKLCQNGNDFSLSYEKILRQIALASLMKN